MRNISWNKHSWKPVSKWGKRGSSLWGKHIQSPNSFGIVKEDIENSFQKGTTVRILKRSELFYTCTGIIQGVDVMQEISRNELIECC